MRSGRLRRWEFWTLAALFAVGCAAIWWGWRDVPVWRRLWPAAEVAQTEGNDVDRLFAVRRGDLSIGLSQGGSVTSSRQHQLALEANVQTKLIWVIKENSLVKKGDVLARFDSEALVSHIDEMDVEYDNLEKELLLQEENEKIKVRSDAAELRSAEDSLVQAREELRKYRRFEYGKNRDAMLLAVKQAEEKLATASGEYHTLRNAVIEPSDSQSQEEARKQREQALSTKLVAITDAENNLKNARNSLKVFRRYDHPNRLRQLHNAEEQAELQLMRVRVSNESNRVQMQRTVENLRKRMENNRIETKKQRGYLEQMQLVAPVDGVVLYGSSDQRRYGAQQELKLGMDVWVGMVLLTIPDMSNLVVEFDLPELYRSRVKVGDVVMVTPDSLPDLKLSGKVETIATLPVNLIFWDSTSPKVYKSRVALDAQNPALVNGMSVKIEIVTKVVHDALYVPVEAVFEAKSRFFVYRQEPGGPKEVTVTLGDANDTFVQILEGLEEGDKVCLYRPYQQGERK